MIQHERDKVRRPCIKILRDAKARGIFKHSVYWACPPDMGKRTPAQRGQMVLDGYTAGNFDLTIIATSADWVKVWLVEFKHGDNGYTKEQKAVVDLFDGTPVNTIQIKSSNAFMNFLMEELI